MSLDFCISIPPDVTLHPGTYNLSDFDVPMEDASKAARVDNWKRGNHASPRGRTTERGQGDVVIADVGSRAVDGSVVRGCGGGEENLKTTTYRRDETTARSWALCIPAFGAHFPLVSRALLFGLGRVLLRAEHACVQSEDDHDDSQLPAGIHAMAGSRQQTCMSIPIAIATRRQNSTPSQTSASHIGDPVGETV